MDVHRASATSANTYAQEYIVWRELRTALEQQNMACNNRHYDVLWHAHKRELGGTNQNMRHPAGKVCRQ